MPVNIFNRCSIIIRKKHIQLQYLRQRKLRPNFSVAYGTE